MEQFYKVINTKNGHHGLFYKLGINTDPNPIPLYRIPSCGKGAIYFCKRKWISKFADYGDSIAWISPVGKYIKDGENYPEKYKAHTINITQILPAKQALLLLPNVTLDEFSDFKEEISFRELVKSKFPNHEIFDYIRGGYGDDYAEMLGKFVVSRKTDVKFIQYVQNENVTWEPFDTELFLKHGLTNLINAGAVQELLVKDEKEILEKLAKKHTKLFIELLGDII